MNKEKAIFEKIAGYYQITADKLERVNRFASYAINQAHFMSAAEAVSVIRNIIEK